MSGTDRSLLCFGACVSEFISVFQLRTQLNIFCPQDDRKFSEAGIVIRVLEGESPATILPRRSLIVCVLVSSEARGPGGQAGAMCKEKLGVTPGHGQSARSPGALRSASRQRWTAGRILYTSKA